MFGGLANGRVISNLRCARKVCGAAAAAFGFLLSEPGCIMRILQTYLSTFVYPNNNCRNGTEHRRQEVAKVVGWTEGDEKQYIAQA